MSSKKTKIRARGIKLDQGKPRMDLLDPYALIQLAWVLTYGAVKYAAHNWRNGINISRLVAAAQRHLAAFNSGQTLDPETGLQHAAHLMCCAMFIVWTIKFRPDLDDRWKGNKKCSYSAKKRKR